VDAGHDMIQCSSSAFELNGTVSDATSYYWTSSNGGTFVPGNSALNAYFTIDPGLGHGYSRLVLTATKSGCPAVHDTMYVFYNPPININAGDNQTICSGSAIINLDGTIGLGSSFYGYMYDTPDKGIWSSSGSGTFGNINSLSTTYAFSPADISAGSVILTLTSRDMGDCQNQSDDVSMTIETCTNIYSSQNTYEISTELYPNPTKGNLTIYTPGITDSRVTVYSAQGHLLKEEVVNAEQFDIDLSDIPEGLYLYRIQNRKKISIGKFIKE
jgi:hypothetical protein